jgi:plasmid stabilization system protein ParE
VQRRADSLENQLADGIHSLLAEKKIGREQENELYELIGKV